MCQLGARHTWLLMRPVWCMVLTKQGEHKFSTPGWRNVLLHSWIRPICHNSVHPASLNESMNRWPGFHCVLIQAVGEIEFLFTFSFYRSSHSSSKSAFIISPRLSWTLFNWLPSVFLSVCFCFDWLQWNCFFVCLISLAWVLFSFITVFTSILFVRHLVIMFRKLS